MGGRSTVVMFLASGFFAIAYEINYVTDMPASNSWGAKTQFVSWDPRQDYFDLSVAESSKPLFNNIFWVPPIQLEHTIDLANNNGKSKIRNKEADTSVKHWVQDYSQLYHNDIAVKEQSGDPVVEYQEAALEKEAEALVEEEYNRQKESDRNRRENNEKDSNAEPRYLVVEPAKSLDDHHGESSDHELQNYVQYHEGDSHYEEREPKKQKEIHYHQHKHLHEHDHLQEHKHQHLNEHKDKHYHEHKQHDDHKHYHEANHKHEEKGEHYHNKYADHKHWHHQDHKHNHKNEHRHEHKQEAWHEHKDKHEHQHRKDSKHYHELKAKHGHHHHHKHDEENKHTHNHWSDHKHGHDHHHNHKSDHYHQHKGHPKVKVHYKKYHKGGW